MAETDLRERSTWTMLTFHYGPDGKLLPESFAVMDGDIWVVEPRYHHQAFEVGDTAAWARIRDCKECNPLMNPIGNDTKTP